MSGPTPLERLRTRVLALGAPLCVGIDPHPDALPDELPRTVQGIERFARGVLEATAFHAAAIKLNLAFFEAWGSAGWAVLERIRREVPAEVVVILDAKRGDIGTSAERYAEALLGRLAADAVTLSPYLGEDAIEPFLAHPDRLVYLLTRTSNPSAGRLQDLDVGGRSLALAVADWAAERWPDGRVGLVVGATAATQLRELRARVPGPPFLVPGVGAQGGDLGAAVGACHGATAPGLVNLSRAITGASRSTDWQRAAASAAEGWRAAMAATGATLSA
ncbi:MAG TPA: orotidine-5'-phosphate decarboxylase [Candidatus Limnocylindria bacterium]|nr:orotidine-5'-phosphate decarboxylase [Candidatus Limnocylindria bacterium]